MAKRRSGFTLLEVILVVTIIVIVGAVAFPVVQTLLRGSERHACVDHLRAKLTDARNRAVNERRDYRFAVLAGSNRYKYAPNTVEFWDDAVAALDPDPNMTEPSALVVEGALPSTEVRFGLLDALDVGTGSWVPVAVFHADGTASAEYPNGVSLQVGDQGNVTTVVVDPSGAITIAAGRSGRVVEVASR